MKRFFVCAAVFAAMFFMIGCDDNDGRKSGVDKQCYKECRDYGESKATCNEACDPRNWEDSLNEYVSECMNAGHSKADCEAWYYEK